MRTWAMTAKSDSVRWIGGLKSCRGGFPCTLIFSVGVYCVQHADLTFLKVRIGLSSNKYYPQIYYLTTILGAKAAISGVICMFRVLFKELYVHYSTYVIIIESQSYIHGNWLSNLIINLTDHNISNKDINQHHWCLYHPVFLSVATAVKSHTGLTSFFISMHSSLKDNEPDSSLSSTCNMFSPDQVCS
jgi:hypothetical protein